MADVFAGNHKVAAVGRPDDTCSFTLIFFIFVVFFVVTSRNAAIITAPSIILDAVGGDLVFYDSAIFLIFTSLFVICTVHPIQVVILCKNHGIGVGRERGP